MKIEREEYETNESYDLRKGFVKKFFKIYKKNNKNKVEVVVFSKIYRNIVLLGCRYEKKVENKIDKINKK